MLSPRSRSRSAESSKLWGLFSATSAAILRTCGRPVVRTQRVDHPPRDRGSTPRRARAVDPRPYYWPLARPHTADWAVAKTPAHRPARRGLSVWRSTNSPAADPPAIDHYHQHQPAVHIQRRGRGSPGQPARAMVSGRHRVHSRTLPPGSLVGHSGGPTPVTLAGWGQAALLDAFFPGNFWTNDQVSRPHPIHAAPSRLSGMAKDVPCL